MRYLILQAVTLLLEGGQLSGEGVTISPEALFFFVEIFRFRIQGRNLVFHACFLSLECFKLLECLPLPTLGIFEIRFGLRFLFVRRDVFLSLLQEVDICVSLTRDVHS